MSMLLIPPSGGGMCGSSLVFPGSFPYDHSLSQPLLLPLRHACLGGARRWTALRVVGFAKLFNVLYYMTGLSGFRLPSASTPFPSSRKVPPFIVHCFDLASPEVSLFPLRSLRNITYLSCPNSPQRLGGWVFSLDLHGSMSPRKCPWHV